MPQDGEPCYEESFNSFLAGVLLTRNRISNFSFFEYLNSFQKYYNVDVTSYGGDIKLPSIYLDDYEIRLLKDIDECVVIDDESMTIRSYLYSFTTPRIREFFGIPEVKVEEKISNTFLRRFFKRNLVRKKVII